MTSKSRLYDSTVRVTYVRVRCYSSLKLTVHFGWQTDVEINMTGVCQ